MTDPTLMTLYVPQGRVIFKLYINCTSGHDYIQARDGRIGSKVGQIGTKWDESGAFSDQISVHLARGCQMH